MRGERERSALFHTLSRSCFNVAQVDHFRARARPPLSRALSLSACACASVDPSDASRAFPLFLRLRVTLALSIYTRGGYPEWGSAWRIAVSCDPDLASYSTCRRRRCCCLFLTRIPVDYRLAYIYIYTHVHAHTHICVCMYALTLRMMLLLASFPAFASCPPALLIPTAR